MFSRLNGPRFLRLIGFAAGAVVIGGIAVVATASAAGMGFGLRPTSPAAANDASLTAAEARVSTAVCSQFMQHFATEIGKSQGEINAAFQRAIADTLADEVKAGHLTQAQADAIKQRVDNQTPCTFPSFKPRGARLEAYMQQYLTAAASALGTTEAQLRIDLRNGRSLSQIAAGKKVSEADFRTRVIGALKPVLDKALADEKLTSAQEEAILEHLKTGRLPLWDKPLKREPPTAASPAAA